jgi:topoisomerase-4 subunit A
MPSGRGSLRMRARWRIEELARGQWRVIVYELPHGVSVAQVLSEIEGLTNPQPRAGKKDVSQEQKNLKALVLGVLDSVRDESSDQQAVRIMLEPKSSRIPQDEFMAVLLAHTSLESSVSVNLTMVGRDGRPQQKNLLTILHEWIAFRFATVERRTRHRLAEVLRRVHILEGRMTVFLKIEEVIRCIRESDEPKPDLMARFGLTEIQAEDILEIRLRQLARLEGIRIEKELGELRTEHGQLTKLLDSRNEMTRLIQKEIGEDAKRFGDERRTLMEAVTPISQGEIAVPDEPVTVIISKNGWVRSRQGHGIDPRHHLQDRRLPLAGGGNAHVWPLIVIDGNGRSYSVKVSDLPGGRGDGAPLNTMIDFQEGGKLALALTAAPESKYLVAGSGGYGFVASVADMIARNKAGKAFLTLDKGEKPLPAGTGHGTHRGRPHPGRQAAAVPARRTQGNGQGQGPDADRPGEKRRGRRRRRQRWQTLRIGGSGRGGKPSSSRSIPVLRRLSRRPCTARTGNPLQIKTREPCLDI